MPNMTNNTILLDGVSIHKSKKLSDILAEHGISFSAAQSNDPSKTQGVTLSFAQSNVPSKTQGVTLSFA